MLFPKIGMEMLSEYDLFGCCLRMGAAERSGAAERFLIRASAASPPTLVRS